jgi:glutaredoxin
MKVVVWSKDNCSYCESAKQLLKMKGVDYEERNISSDKWTKEDLLSAAPTARTVPQIFFGDVCVGGFEDLRKRLG